MRFASRLSLVLLAALVLCLPAAPAAAQCVSLTTLGSASTQNFDTLSNTAGSTTNSLTIPGWFLTESGGGARDNEQYAVDTGGSTTGDMYSYGAAGSTERALGQLRSGTLIPLFGACFTNNTGSTITSLAVAYTGEEWRLGTAARTDQMNFEYSLNATDLVTGTWTGVAALNFVTPDTATTGAKNGNAAADRTALSSTITSLSIANGATFWIRWNDTDATGADDGLAVDDFSITPQAVVPPNLSINDVSLNEGNAGTTSFTFTVSLSTPAGPGGVTFDIATADGTATAPSDYTAKSLTGQTIPAGSSTYSFTVLVNGDTTPETNETFFVNVTNVTGAVVTDGQGQGTIVNDDAAPNLTINDVTLNEGNAGTTTFTFTVSLSAPAGAGGVTFDIATANGTATAGSDYTAKSLTGQMIPAGSSTYTFDVLVNGDTTPETDETFFVNVTNITNAIGVDTQGLGTIVNDDITFIHDVQGNGAATPIPGATVTVEGIVTANFQGANKLKGFFLQEEDTDADADPNTSEGIFIFCNTCPTAVAEGQRVKATGTVSEFTDAPGTMTEISATTAGSVVVTDAGNHLAEVTPAVINLPVVGDLNAFYEAREGMLVTFADTLTVSEYFQLGRFGQIVLTQGGRSFQFTETSPPSVAGNTAHLDAVARREVILDDNNNAQEWYLTSSTPPGPPDGQQFVFYPQANGGFSVGTQGVDFFRGGDLVNGLTGVLHWSFPGFGPATWRIRPAAAHPVTFTVANPRPVTAPAVGGAIKAVGMNLLNYFTTIDTSANSNTGPCGPTGGQNCRGADSVAELNRQRERASIVVCTLNADVYAFMELENTTPSDTITDLLGAINARCGGAHPYAFVNTGGTLGTDAIRVQLIYRTGIVSPVGSPLVDLDPVHNRPPTAQTFDVVDATNPAFGKRFTVIANHFKSKGSCPGSGPDTDQNDGQSCWNATRTQQATRLLTWINGTVIPAAGDPDVLLLGDFNSYAKEDPVTTLESGGFTDLETTFDASTYSYLFNAELGHLDYGFASASLLPQVTGAAPWHINADEVDLFDYNDEIRDVPGEATFEEKPDGSALTPPRVVFAPGTPYRASDHDPVLVGLFPVADLAITKTDGVTTATPGGSATYTITASNAGPSNDSSATVADTFPAALTCTWTCVGAGGGTCTASGSGNVNDTVNLPSGGSVTYTATCAISASATGSLSNTATVSNGMTSDSNAANNSATDTDTLTPQADLAITKTDGVTTATPGGSVTYTITASNAGPSNAPGSTVADTFPTSLTCTWTCVGAGGGTCTASGSGNVNDTVNLPAGGSVTYTASCTISAAATGTLSNTATVAAPGGVTDPTPGNNSATDSDTLSPQADLSITKTDGVTSATPGGSTTYTITASNAGPSNATGATVADTFPASLTCTWTCVGAGGGTCTASGSGNLGDTVNLPAGGSVTYTASCTISASATGTLSNTATVTAPGGVTDPTPGNNSATDSDTLAAQADLAITKKDGVTSATPGGSVTYTITASNSGPSDATGAMVTDTFPASLTCTWTCVGAGGGTCTASGSGNLGDTVNLPAGGSVTYTASCTISAAATGTLSNTATVTAPGGVTDPTPGNNSATDSDTLAAQADLAITKSDGVTTATAGGSVTYTITASNPGPSDATGATVTDTFPASLTCTWTCVGAGGGTCTASGSGNLGDTVNLPAGGSVTYTASCTIAASATGTLSNTATVTAPGGVTDPTPGNNSATDNDTLTAPPGASLSGTKTAAGSFTPGSTVTYTVVLTNNGPGTQGDNPGNEFTDVLPAGLTLVSATATSGTALATVGTNTVTWNGSLAAGASVTITITATIDPNAAPGTTLTNQGTIAFDANGDGTNEASAQTDDPSQGGGADPTAFQVAAPPAPDIPTLDTVGLTLLALLLALGGAALLRRRRA
ncbi:MAG: ExeM/NucH family extracellular endonuclease [Acidobacteria bacterium]|nr:ExeM/NucH family extracellular endonuclease [Acidobacteriota bacterium]